MVVKMSLLVEKKGKMTVEWLNSTEKNYPHESLHDGTFNFSRTFSRFGEKENFCEIMQSAKKFFHFIAPLISLGSFPALSVHKTFDIEGSVKSDPATKSLSRAAKLNLWKTKSAQSCATND